MAGPDKYKHIRRPDQKQLKGQDLFEFESHSGRYSTLSSAGGHDTLTDELRYIQDDSDFRYSTMNPSPGVTFDSDSRHGAVTPSSVTASCDDAKYHLLPDDSHEFSEVWSPGATEYARDQYKYHLNVNGSGPYRGQSTDEMLDELEEHSASVRLQQQQQSLAAAPPTAHISEIDYHLREFGNGDLAAPTSLNLDNVTVEREPIHSGFLVSFMVDARGGVLNGSRHSGIRLIIPPGRATMPTRVVCKLVKKERLASPPVLNEGEALANRILQMGSSGLKFSGPVLIEVPHFASLQGKDREITVLRSDNGLTWSEHPIIATDDAVKRALGPRFAELESAEKLYQRQVARILTDSFPSYFAIVTRIRQDVKTLGPKGGFITSTVAPQVQAHFPEGALTKAIKIGLEAHSVDPNLVKKTLGGNVAVSPIVTVEPRHRKFHQPISITLPIPVLDSSDKSRHGAGSPTLRLLCSLVGGTAPSQWEDITGSSPLTLSNDCASFTTTVSARFWLMDCQNINNCARMANALYGELISVPMVARFVVFGRRRNPTEGRLRAFCMTDDKLEKTLEKEQYFREVARSKDIEVFEGKTMNINTSGNLEPVLKTDEQLILNFQAFHENRIHFLVRLRDAKADPSGQVIFLPDTRTPDSDHRLPPTCVLSVTLPEADEEPRPAKRIGDTVTPGLELRNPRLFPVSKDFSAVDRAELRLTDISNAVQYDWEALAKELGVDKKEVEANCKESDPPNEKASVMLHLWVAKYKQQASGNELERALTRIGRDEVIYTCMRNIQPVTDEQEIRSALVSIERGMSNVPELQLDEGPLTGDVFHGLDSKPELGSIREEDAPVAEAVLASQPIQQTQVELTNQDSQASHDDLDVGGLRIYTDMQEGRPELETDIQEMEEVLDDGTIVKRKTIVTQQKQRITQRVVMEGPEDELPGSEEQAEEVLRQLDVVDPELRSATAPQEPHTEIQEFEETLPDGEIVQRRIITTTQQSTKKKKVPTATLR